MHSAFRLGDWFIDPQRDRIVNAGNETKVEPRAMQVLAYLAEHAGEVVTREQILEKVWEGTFVSDEVLTSAIRKLRHAFGEDAGDGGFIQTVPKKGYRLNAPVESVEKDEPTPTPLRQL